MYLFKKSVYLLLVTLLFISCSSTEEKLMNSIQSGNLIEVENILKNGTNPNIVFDNGLTPLTLAIDKSNSKIISTLIEFDADITFNDRFGHTPFIKAIINENFKIINLLCNNYNCNNELFDSIPPQILSKQKNTEILAFLKEKNVNFDMVDDKGSSLLMLAAKDDNFVLVKFLVNDNQRRISTKNNEGQTVFDYVDKESPIGKYLTDIKNIWPKTGDIAYVVMWCSNKLAVTAKVRITNRKSKKDIIYVQLEKSFLISLSYRFRECGSFYQGKTYSDPEKYFFKTEKDGNKKALRKLGFDTDAKKIYY